MRASKLIFLTVALCAGTVDGIALRAAMAAPSTGELDRPALMAARSATEVPKALGVDQVRPDAAAEVFVPDISLANEKIPLAVRVQATSWRVLVVATQCPEFKVLAVIEPAEIENPADAKVARDVRCRSSGSVVVWVKDGDNLYSSNRRLRVATPIK